MREHTPKSLYLDYLQASLADGSRLSPDLNHSQAVEVSFSDLQRGQLDEPTRQELLNQAKKAAKTQKEDHQLWPIPVTVCPRVFSLRPRHGHASERLPRWIAPVFIQALLLPKGPLQGDEQTNTPVVFARNFLDPSPSPITLGTVEAADTAYAQHSTAANDWPELMQQAQDLSLAICGHTLSDLSLDDYEPLEHALVLLGGANTATAAIENLVGQPKSCRLPSCAPV